MIIYLLDRVFEVDPAGRRLTSEFRGVIVEGLAIEEVVAEILPLPPLELPEFEHCDAMTLEPDVPGHNRLEIILLLCNANQIMKP